MKNRTFSQILVFICIAIGVMNIWFDSIGIWWVCGCGMAAGLFFIAIGTALGDWQ